MGTFCIVFGIIIPILFALCGHAVGCLFFVGENTNMIFGSAPFTFKAFLMFPEPEKLARYLIVVGIMTIIGLLIGAGVFTSGLVYNKLNKRLDRVERISRKAARKLRTEE